jgi:hypothetical protein
MAKKATAKRKPAPKRKPAQKRKPAPKRKPTRHAAKKRPAAKRPAARRPATADFDVVVQVGKGQVSVLFRPTKSHYLFRIAADRDAKPRAGAKPRPNVELQAGVPGASDSYMEAEILAMSTELASAAVKDVLV